MLPDERRVSGVVDFGVVGTTDEGKNPLEGTAGGRIEDCMADC